MLVASMAAESLKLEGIVTSTEDVLAAIESTEGERVTLGPDDEHIVKARTNESAAGKGKIEP